MKIPATRTSMAFSDPVVDQRQVVARLVCIDGGPRPMMTASSSRRGIGAGDGLLRVHGGLLRL
jgi:hypothetical protein